MRGPAHITAAVLSASVAWAPLLKGDEHTLGELLSGATLSAGGLTFHNWSLDLSPFPKFGSNNQDIENITISATASNGPAVALRWEANGELQTLGREEMDFVIRYTVTASEGYVALAKNELVSSTTTSPTFPESAPVLFVEQFVVVAGTLSRGLVVLDVAKVRPADAHIIDPQTAVDVATHIVLRGEQRDDDANFYDLVRLSTMDQTFWRAKRILTVNSTVDQPDGNIGDGIADTGTTSAPTGITTLRAALNEADGTPELDFIKFDIPGASIPTIQPRSELYGGLGALHPVIVDGDSQEAGWVELDGTNSRAPFGGVPTVGLEFVGHFSAVRGLVINRFDSHGIQIRQSGAPFKGNNLIVGNRIGTDATGVQNLGNHGDGVRIVEQPANLVGGSEPNVIKNNDGHGVAVVGLQSLGNAVGDNTIQGNGGSGVFIAEGAGANEEDLAQVVAGAVFGNTITANGGAGVRVEASAGPGNQISFNSISANGGLGIDIAAPGVTTVAVPVLTKIISADGTTLIDGHLQGERTRFYRLEFFVNATPDPSGYGEGAQPFGSGGLYTDSTGKDERANGVRPGFPFIFGRPVPAGFVVTATATPRDGSTTEFSHGQPASSNALPIADAGDPQTVIAGTRVTLDGSASNDPDTSPAPLSFSWQQNGGPANVALNNSTTAKPDFTPTVEGTYTFLLTVHDGLNSDQDSVYVIVNAATSNAPPKASATASASATIGENVTLNGSASVDPDNGPSPLTYSWTQLSGPAVALAGANAASASFTPTTAGIYGFRLTVSDGMASDHADVTVMVTAGGGVNAIENLMSDVRALSLDAQSEKRLLEKLETALTSVQRGKNNAAQGQLGAFINNVESLVHSRKLAAGAADALIRAASAVIASLDEKSGKPGSKA